MAQLTPSAGGIHIVKKCPTCKTPYWFKGHWLRQNAASVVFANADTLISKVVINNTNKLSRCLVCPFYQTLCSSGSNPFNQPSPGARNCGNHVSAAGPACCCDCPANQYRTISGAAQNVNPLSSNNTGGITTQNINESTAWNSYSIVNADIKKNTNISNAIPNANHNLFSNITQVSLLESNVQTVLIDTWKKSFSPNTNIGKAGIDKMVLDILRSKRLNKISNLSLPDFIYLPEKSKQIISNKIYSITGTTLSEYVDTKSRTLLDSGEYIQTEKDSVNKITKRTKIHNISIQRSQQNIKSSVGTSTNVDIVKVSYSMITNVKNGSLVKYETTSTNIQNLALYARANIKATARHYVGDFNEVPLQ